MARNTPLDRVRTTEWKRDDALYQVNIIDTPGHVDFTVEVERSLRVLDGAVAVFCAVGGVEPQSETVWRQADKYSVPRIAFVNKMDRTGADFANVVAEIRQRLGAKAFPVQIPLGSGDLFTGLVDVVRRVEVVYDEASLGQQYVEGPVPASMREQVEKLRHELIEAAVESDDELLEKYLGQHDLSEAEVRRAIRKATIGHGLVPIFCGAAAKNKGVQRLLDGVVDYLPSPVDIPPVQGHLQHHSETHACRDAKDDAPFAALAFKIMTD
ncbi:MAG: elongation factor G, partial [Gemmatimonadetes bacterium 21-71-4]